MQITAIEPFSVALPRPGATTAGRRASRRSGVRSWSGSRATTAREGLGEAPVTPEWGGDHRRYYGETPQTAAHLIRDLIAPAIVGMDPFDIGAIHDRMEEVVKGHLYTKAAVDIACYDLMGKAAGLPVHALLGGKRRDTIEIATQLRPQPVSGGGRRGGEGGARRRRPPLQGQGRRGRGAERRGARRAARGRRRRGRHPRRREHGLGRREDRAPRDPAPGALRHPLGRAALRQRRAARPGDGAAATSR